MRSTSRASDGIRWVTYRLGDGLSFIDYSGGDAPPEALGAIDGFARFRAGLEDRCAEGPEMEFLNEVDSYGFH